jgi:hypothetical protein
LAIDAEHDGDTVTQSGDGALVRFILVNLIANFIVAHSFSIRIGASSLFDIPSSQKENSQGLN